VKGLKQQVLNKAAVEVGEVKMEKKAIRDMISNFGREAQNFHTF
jgi:hypothetical protein